MSTLLKNTTHSFLPSPLLNPKTVEAPRFLDNPPYVLVFSEPPLPLPLKLRFFSEPP